ncbi:DUF5683 domain-containing protein [candidate division KSB1 bacterium]
MKKNIIIILSLILLISIITPLKAQKASVLYQPSDEYLLDLNKIQPVFMNKGPEDFNIQSAQKDRSRSTLRAVLLSALVPGAGQFYLGDRYKAAGFLGAEIMMIFGWRYYDNEGEKIDLEFREYADDNWDETEYFEWKNAQPPGTTFSHTLPGVKNQQYYEMIGKYNQFLAGWPDTTEEPRESQMRLYYMRRQDDSNTQYKRGELLVNLILVNHVASAIEAAISGKRKNSNLKTGLTFQPYEYNREIIPVFYVHYRR